MHQENDLNIETPIHEEVLSHFEKERDIRLLAKELKELHADDIVRVITELTDDEQDEIMRLLPTELKAEVIDEANDELTSHLLEHLADLPLVSILNEMPPDEAADALEQIDEERAGRLLKIVNDEHADHISELRKYKPETAGRIMTTEFLAIERGQTVAEVVQTAREQADDLETLHNIFVINDRGRLVGEVHIQDLLTAEDETHISKIMDRGIISIDARRDQEVAARMMEKYELAVLPVVEDGGQLAGIITFDDIMEVMEEEATEDMYRLAGIGADNPLAEKVLPRAIKRLPWLTTTLIGGLSLAFIISYFHTTLERVVALVSFIPVIAGLGGNVGIQSSTITVRGLATGDITVSDVFWLLRRELAVASIIGIVCAIVLSTVARIFLGVTHSFDGDMLLFCGALSAALFCGMLTAALIGTMAPLICHRMGVDPAYAAGPFVTVTIDVTTQTIYLSIATALLL
jgi:magnesium transporter